jgi:hypothetical protein
MPVNGGQFRGRWVVLTESCRSLIVALLGLARSGSGYGSSLLFIEIPSKLSHSGRRRAVTAAVSHLDRVGKCDFLGFHGSPTNTRKGGFRHGSPNRACDVGADSPSGEASDECSALSLEGWLGAVGTGPTSVCQGEPDEVSPLSTCLASAAREDGTARSWIAGRRRYRLTGR